MHGEFSIYPVEIYFYIRPNYLIIRSIVFGKNENFGNFKIGKLFFHRIISRFWGYFYHIILSYILICMQSYYM